MIKYEVEQIDDALPDLRRLLEAQWAETGDNTLTFGPNWDFYRALERSSNAALIVARENNRAIGYLWAIVHPSVNAGTAMVGTISTWFMEQRPARALLDRSLLRAGIVWARSKAARNVTVETEYHHSAGRLLEAMGFEPAKIGYKLALEAKHA